MKTSINEGIFIANGTKICRLNVPQCYGIFVVMHAHVSVNVCFHMMSCDPLHFPALKTFFQKTINYILKKT